jgi:peptide/nickel transport system substrate-binding protein
LDVDKVYRVYVALKGAITIVPKHVFEKVDPLNFKNYPPIGTGPYKLVRAEPTMTVFERRDDWWGTRVFGVRPAPQYIVYANFGPEDGSWVWEGIADL